MNYTKDKWVLSVNDNWKTNPFSITTRKYGVHSTTIANIPTRMTIPPAEQKANACLVAAAPDLYEALRALFACLYDHERDDETIAAVAQTKAAIEKAEGL